MIRQPDGRFQGVCGEPIRVDASLPAEEGRPRRDAGVRHASSSAASARTRISGISSIDIGIEKAST